MFLRQIRYRIGQGLSRLRPVSPADGDLDIARSYLTALQFDRFRTMSAHDQHHHCCVARKLIGEGLVDPDLLTAALLHDIGKYADGRGPRLIDRSIYVLLERIRPGSVRKISRRHRWWNEGLVLLAEHAQRGADIADHLGCNERVRELIVRHGDQSTGNDAHLTALQRADSVC